MLTTSERYSDSSSYKAGYWNVTDEMRKDSQHRSTQHAVNTTVTFRTGHNRVTCTGFKSSHEPASYWCIIFGWIRACFGWIRVL